MVDITHKQYTLRTAIATATVRVSSINTIEAVQNKTVPKGDVLEMSKTAGLFAIKNTSSAIPDCHPLPIEHATVQFKIEDLEIHIEVKVSTIYKTGVEVEAMHGAAIVALTIYDMLKPIDKGIEILSIKLKEKEGGKSNFERTLNIPCKAAVIICSDSIFKGKKSDRVGKLITEKLKQHNIETAHYELLPNELKGIQEKIISLYNDQYDLIVLAGGTGLSINDVTPEAVRPLLDYEIPGMAEAMRSYGQERTPFAMLSRSMAGMKGQTLIVALPGSTKGAEESLQPLFPSILHLFNVAEKLKSKG